jgi:transposase
MAESRRKFDQDFKEGAVRIVRETGKPVAQVARDLGVNEGTLGNWVMLDRRRRGEGNGALGEDERAELARLRRENAQLAMERDVLKRSVALWAPARWAGEPGGRDRVPEGAARHPAGGVVPGAGRKSGVFYKWCRGDVSPRRARRAAGEGPVAL